MLNNILLGFACTGNESFVGYIYCKYLLPVDAFSSHVVYGVFSQIEVLNFNRVRTNFPLKTKGVTTRAKPFLGLSASIMGFLSLFYRRGRATCSHSPHGCYINSLYFLISDFWMDRKSQGGPKYHHSHSQWSVCPGLPCPWLCQRCWTQVLSSLCHKAPREGPWPVWDIGSGVWQRHGPGKTESSSQWGKHSRVWESWGGISALWDLGPGPQTLWALVFHDIYMGVVERIKYMLRPWHPALLEKWQLHCLRPYIWQCTFRGRRSHRPHRQPKPFWCSSGEVEPAILGLLHACHRCWKAYFWTRRTRWQKTSKSK